MRGAKPLVSGGIGCTAARACSVDQESELWTKQQQQRLGRSATHQQGLRVFLEDEGARRGDEQACDAGNSTLADRV